MFNLYFKIMMKKFTLLLLIGLCSVFGLRAQEEDKEPSLLISGSVDTYYKYDFSGESQIGTSFAGAQNSIGIGMVDLVFEQQVGKASFVGEVAFGPRADGSAPGAVQQLYVSYAVSDKVSFTGGFMGTYVGYEIISPTGNFNYSTSYLFSNGPFQQAGIKMDYAVSDRFALMFGVFNEFDSYTNSDGGLDLGAQMYFLPVDGWDVYLNFVTSNDSGTEIDITTTFQATDRFLIGLNAAQRTRGNFFNDSEGGGVNFSGAALYLNYGISDMVGLGLRSEYFTDDKGSIFGYEDPNAPGTLLTTSVAAFTLSGNIGSGPLTLIPEIRADFASEDIFKDSDKQDSNVAGQFLLAAYYAF